VLLELTTKLEDKPEQKSEDIPPDDLLVVEVRGAEGQHRPPLLPPSLSSLLLSLRPTEVPQEA